MVIHQNIVMLMEILKKKKRNNDMSYTITIDELINREIIRGDQSEEWLNKMTDEEIDEWFEEATELCVNEGVKIKFPDINSAVATKLINRTILYKLYKMENP